MSAVTESAPHLLEQAGAVADGDQYADSTAILLPVESVMVAERYRKDLGDVTDLAKSIVDVGLLNPITVREWHGGYRLVAGERRLTAFKSLGLAEIPARVARDIADARDALVAERDENTARKPMLPSESAALGMAIEEMERPAALERRNAQLKNVGASFGSRDPNEKDEMRPRDIAAEAIGMGEATYRRIKTVMSVANDETAPEDIRDVARDALTSIDKGASVRSEYNRVAEARRDAPAKAAPAGPSGPRSNEANGRNDYLRTLADEYPTLRIAFANTDEYSTLEAFNQAARKAGVTWRFTERQWQMRVATSTDVLNRSSLAVEVALSAIAERVDMATITPEQAAEALERLDSSALNRIIRQLKEISNG